MLAWELQAGSGCASLWVDTVCKSACRVAKGLARQLYPKLLMIACMQLQQYTCYPYAITAQMNSRSLACSPDPLVETASLASIKLPKPTFKHALNDCVKNHLLSDAQVGQAQQPCRAAALVMKQAFSMLWARP